MHGGEFRRNAVQNSETSFDFYKNRYLWISEVSNYKLANFSGMKSAIDDLYLGCDCSLHFQILRFVLYVETCRTKIEKLSTVRRDALESRYALAVVRGEQFGN